MGFGTKRFISQRKLPSLFISDEEIKYTDQYKYLGVMLDCNLTFQAHMNHVYKLASHKIYLLSKIRHYVNANAALSIYKTKILPYLDLGDIFYLGSHQKSTMKLQRLQNRALRVCIRAAPRTSTNALHVLAQVPLLEHRRLSHLRNYMYKRKENPDYVVNAQLPTRNFDAVMLKTIKANYALVERSIFCKGSWEWNSLDTNQRSIPTYNRFKTHKKRWLNSTLQYA